MRIIVISFHYGEQASGVITERVVKALIDAGHPVKVITSSMHYKKDVDVIQVQAPYEDSFVIRAFRFLLRKIGFRDYVFHLLWRRKAYKVASVITEEWHPDWIICRSTPFDANAVGFMLKKKYGGGIRLLQHFTDPLPYPEQLVPSQCVRRKLIELAKRIIQSADMVSFGNQAMAKYVMAQTALNKDFFVSPDASSSSVQSFYGASETNDIIYFGNINARNSSPLVSALDEINRGKDIDSTIKLHIFSVPPKFNAIQSPYVVYEGTTKNVANVFKKAKILVDIDIDNVDIYISSKLKDYLLVNRPILSITSETSASSQILNQYVTVKCVRNNVTDILQGIRESLRSTFDNDLYREREELIDYFSPQTVVTNLIAQLESYDHK